MSENKKNEQKQHTPEFENCVEQVMKQGHTKESAFAICTATFAKASRPVFIGIGETQKLHLFSESVKLKDHKVSGVCIHPKRIFHPEESMTHVYLRDELQKATPTLIGKPFGIDHMYVLPPPNVITNAWYDPSEDGVAFEGVVDDEIVEQIQNRVFKGLSIELSWLRPGGRVEFVNGVAPRNFELTSVHLLKRFPPGDKDAYVNFWNAIMEQLVVSPALTLDEKVAQLEEQLCELSEKVAVLAGKFEVITGVPQSVVMKEAALAEAEKTGASKFESSHLVALRKQLVETEANLATSQKQATSAKVNCQRLVEAIKGTHPVIGVQKSWSLGPQKMIAEQLRVLREFESES